MMKKPSTKTKLSVPGVNFVSEVRTELKKVSWPTRKQIVRMSTLVIVISVVTSLYLGGLDYLFVQLVSFLINQ